MGKTAADPKIAIRATLRERAEQLIDIEIKHQDIFAKMKGIESDLKGYATELGYSVKEDFTGKGEVSISGRKDKDFKGNLPEVDPAVFNALPAAERKVLVKRGVIKMVPTWSRADYGRVATKLFVPQGRVA